VGKSGEGGIKEMGEIKSWESEYTHRRWHSSSAKLTSADRKFFLNIIPPASWLRWDWTATTANRALQHTKLPTRRGRQHRLERSHEPATLTSTPPSRNQPPCDMCSPASRGGGGGGGLKRSLAGGECESLKIPKKRTPAWPEPQPSPPVGTGKHSRSRAPCAIKALD